MKDWTRERRVVCDLRVDLLGVLMVVEEASLDLSFGKLRKRSFERPSLLLGRLIVPDNFPDTEASARNLRLPPGGFIGEVDPWALSHAQGFLKEVL
ncbi:MAG TPA: hypothetical protein VGC81_17680, partial [Candidatus Methylomirabilis sp.]